MTRDAHGAAPTEPGAPDAFAGQVPLSGASILVIEDEASITQLVRLYLERAGARVESAIDGASGLALFERQRPQLVILDLMLPGLDGWTVCQRIRQSARTPILMLTALREEDELVHGLDLGADDYVTKPFSPRELVSRVHAILRRAAGEGDTPTGGERLACAGLTIVPSARQVQVDGLPVELTAKEFDLLLTLARAPDRVFTRQALFSQVWGFDYLGDTRTVDVHIGTLRKKLEARHPQRHYIRTVRAVGYGFDATGEQDDNTPAGE